MPTDEKTNENGVAAPRGYAQPPRQAGALTPEGPGPAARVCACGHSQSTHMHNFTGEMFGSVVAHCAWCKCADFAPAESSESLDKVDLDLVMVACPPWKEGKTWDALPGDEYQWHGEYSVNISAWRRYAKSLDKMAPVHTLETP